MTELKEFDDLINLGRVTRTVKLLNREIVLATLDSEEYAEAMSRIPQGDSVLDSDRLEAMQREIVAAAIKSIDGKELSSEMKNALVNKGQLGLSNLLYNEYIAMVGEQNSIFEDAKKNSSQAKMPLKTSQEAPVSS